MPCLHCNLSELLEQTRPPDPDMVALIEQAFIEGQIDSDRAELAYLWHSKVTKTAYIHSTL